METGEKVAMDLVGNSMKIGLSGVAGLIIVSKYLGKEVLKLDPEKIYAGKNNINKLRNSNSKLCSVSIDDKESVNLIIKDSKSFGLPVSVVNHNEQFLVFYLEEDSKQMEKIIEDHIKEKSKDVEPEVENPKDVTVEKDDREKNVADKVLDKDSTTEKSSKNNQTTPKEVKHTIEKNSKSTKPVVKEKISYVGGDIQTSDIGINDIFKDFFVRLFEKLLNVEVSRTVVITKDYTNVLKQSAKNQDLSMDSEIFKDMLDVLKENKLIQGDLAMTDNKDNLISIKIPSNAEVQYITTKASERDIKVASINIGEKNILMFNKNDISSMKEILVNVPDFSDKDVNKSLENERESQRITENKGEQERTTENKGEQERTTENKEGQERSEDKNNEAVKNDKINTESQDIVYENHNPDNNIMNLIEEAKSELYSPSNLKEIELTIENNVVTNER